MWLIFFFFEKKNFDLKEGGCYTENPVSVTLLKISLMTFKGQSNIIFIKFLMHIVSFKIGGENFFGGTGSFCTCVRNFC